MGAGMCPNLQLYVQVVAKDPDWKPMIGGVQLGPMQSGPWGCLLAVMRASKKTIGK